MTNHTTREATPSPSLSEQDAAFEAEYKAIGNGMTEVIRHAHKTIQALVAEITHLTAPRHVRVSAQFSEACALVKQWTEKTARLDRVCKEALERRRAEQQAKEAQL